jgi:thioredoxin reductase
VRSVAVTADGFDADVDGDVVRARRLLLASGVRDVVPDIPGFDVHYGADVFHCPTCEGFEARDRAVVVIGWSAHVPAFATQLLDWASTVTIVADGPAEDIGQEQRRELAARGIALVERAASELCGPRGRLEGVRLADGRLLEADLAFFSIGHEADLALAGPLGCELTPDGLVAVDHEGRTSVPGVYAAGDLTPGVQLVPVASSKGVIAGVACARSFHGQRTAGDAPPPAPTIEGLGADR